MLSNIFTSPILTLDGRINRKKFAFHFILAIAYLPLLSLLGLLFESFQILEYIEKSKYASIGIGIILCLPLVIFVTKCIHRCHDLGVSALYSLIPFFFLFMLFTKGQNCVNEFGEDPVPEDASKITLLNRENTSRTINKTGVFKIFLMFLVLMPCLSLLFLAL